MNGYNNKNATSVAQKQDAVELTELLKSVNKNIVELIQVMKTVNMRDKNADQNQTSIATKDDERIKFSEPKNPINKTNNEQMIVIKGVEP